MFSYKVWSFFSQSNQSKKSIFWNEPWDSHTINQMISETQDFIHTQ